MDDQVYDYIVIGAGPAGIGFINTIKTHDNVKVALIELGSEMDSRTCQILQNKTCQDCTPGQCPMIHGIGGASLLGGYKLSCFPAGTFLNNILSNNTSDTKCYNDILERFANLFKLDENKTLSLEEIKIAEKYYQTKKYNFKYYKSYICELEQFKIAYNKFLFTGINCNLDIFLQYEAWECTLEDDNLYNIYIKKKQNKKILKTKHIILATGRSGSKLLKLLNDKFELGAAPNHLEVGVRIEFPTHIFPDIDKHHNDLKLLRNDVRTFCISKNGRLSPYFANGMYIVDGYYSKSKKTTFTNLALMYRLPENKFNPTIQYIKNNIRKISKGIPIIQDYESLKLRQSPNLTTQFDSSIIFFKTGNIHDIYPTDIYNILVKEIIFFVESFIPKKYHNQINIIAPAIEYYWPDFPIDNNFMIKDNIYMIGDCCGKYRGILQAYVAGAALCSKLINKI